MYLLIDMPVPSERNTFTKTVINLSKYKEDLEIEIYPQMLMWVLKTKTVPVVIGAVELVKLKKHTNKIPGNINIIEVQKIALLGSAHILRRVLSIK